MAKISRTRRAEMHRRAHQIRRDGQHNHRSVEQIVTAIIAEIPDMLALEAWRLAYGWSRPQAIAGIITLYEAEGRDAPPINSSMLCRWEHGHAVPDVQYEIMLSRLYQATALQLGLKHTARLTTASSMGGDGSAHLAQRDRAAAKKPAESTESQTPQQRIGLDFPRELAVAIDTATTWWNRSDQMGGVTRRQFAGTSLFTTAAFTTPMARWLLQPADASVARTAPHHGGRRVGARDIAELHEAAEQARRFDSKYGGGAAGAGMVAVCLRERAAPLLHGTYTEETGRRLFSATAQLARLAGYSAWDVGRHDHAQRHYIQALRLARAAGDVPLGGYILASMSLQAGLLDRHGEAIDMAQAGYERAKNTATPRTLAFFKLAEARAHARAGDHRAAGLALAHSEALLSKAKPSDDDPHWIDFFTYPRLAADATEIHRDLAMPDIAMRFEEQATMPTNAFARSYGMRSAIVGSAHLQARRLDEALALGHRSIDVLTHVASVRALEYLSDLLARMDPWVAEKPVIELRYRARQELGLAAGRA